MQLNTRSEAQEEMCTKDLQLKLLVLLGHQGRNAQEKLQSWVCMPLTPTLRRLRQEDSKFEASLGYRDPLSKKKTELQDRASTV
jgi:hypothetical protein